MKATYHKVADNGVLVWARTVTKRIRFGGTGYRSEIVRLDVNRLIQQGSMTVCPPVDWFQRVLLWYRSMGDDE